MTVTTFGKSGKYAENEYSSPAHASHGIGVWIAAVFILGEMAGGGVIAMPFAMYQAGEFIFLAHFGENVDLKRTYKFLQDGQELPLISLEQRFLHTLGFNLDGVGPFYKKPGRNIVIKFENLIRKLVIELVDG